MGVGEGEVRGGEVNHEEVESRKRKVERIQYYREREDESKGFGDKNLLQFLF